MAPPAAWKRRAIAGAVLSAISALAAFGFWRFQGNQGLAGAAVGIVLGTALSFLSHHLRRRARAAIGLKVVQAMLLSTFASFGFFIALSILLALFWPEGAAAVVLSALGIYLAVSFTEAVIAE